MTDKILANFEGVRNGKPTCLTEIQALFGLLFYIGKLRRAHLNSKDLWATDDVISSRCNICIATMSRRRFQHLLRCLRFDDIRTREAGKLNDKLAAIICIFQLFVSHIQRHCAHGEHVTIDEMLLAFRGRCPFRSYLPNKPAKDGLSVRSL